MYICMADGERRRHSPGKKPYVMRVIILIVFLGVFFSSSSSFQSHFS